MCIRDSLSAGPDPPVELSVGGARQWGVPPPVVQPGAHAGYPGLPSAPRRACQAIPRLCYGAEDKDAGMYSLDGQPKMVEEAVDRMQFLQHSRQGCPPKLKRDVRAVTPEEESQGTGNGRPSRKIQDPQSRLKELERALQPVQPNPTRNTSPPRAAVKERSPPACYKCRELGHYRRNCPRNSGMTGNTGGTRH